MPAALLALAAGAFGIGTTEFIIMGLLTQVSQDLHISIPTAGTLISGYAVGVAVGAPVLTLASRRWPRRMCPACRPRWSWWRATTWPISWAITPAS